MYRFHFQFLLYYLGPIFVKLLNVFYTAKQAETVSYTVVFNVLLNQLECIYNYIVYMKVVLLSKDIVASIITVHLWVFPSHSNHKGHAVSVRLWFRKEAILISCTYCNAHYSHCYLSLSHDHLLHAITSLCTVATTNCTIPLLPCRLQTCQMNYLSCSPTCRQQSSSGSRTGRAILRRAPSLILSRKVLRQPCCS